jgi:hypothetical protein
VTIFQVTDERRKTHRADAASAKLLNYDIDNMTAAERVRLDIAALQAAPSFP